MDDDPFVSCPYNKVHRVPLSRLQGHIVKCQKNYPELKICPYNATHRYQETEIHRHVKNCVSKEQVFPETTKEDRMADFRRVKCNNESDFIPESDPNHEIWDD
ncbi:hypothetical protein K1T71_014397 [Dendrolimus kikuchii]|uniref:Uncharacterized protein n=1 Tax=Dendrolimus kikuchii TaxID=765133 RepID=A0ACC1CE78_9NEOP|nr:hypothetical protein K1T71_014397 [Dendrolimus kikuchii]